MANNIIIPQVFSDAVNAKLQTSIRIGSVAYDATPNDLYSYGDTVHYPVFTRNTDTTEVTKGTALTPSNVDMSECTSKVKQQLCGSCDS